VPVRGTIALCGSPSCLTLMGHAIGSPVRLRLLGACVDLVLHAGDVCTSAVLDELATFAPVRVVLGNNDGMDVAAWGAQPTLEFDLNGLRWP
jgi:predicted phosphodiesterase